MNSLTRPDMKWTSWLLFGLALVLVIGGVAMVRRQSKTTPEDFFTGVEERILSGRYDREQAIQNLDQVLERAQASGNTDLAARVLLLRGRTLRDLGAYDRAKSDLVAVAAMRPTDPAVEDDLVELEARAGDFHAALARVQRIVEREPEKPHGYVMLGRLHRQAADKALAQGQELLARTLVAETGAQAVALLLRSVALEPADPQRIAIAHRLRGLLRLTSEARIEEVLDVADRAARDLDAAREAYAASLAHGVEPEAITGLVDLLQRAGQTALAVDLATVTVRMPSMRADPQFARTLVRALAELGRLRYAGEIAESWARRTTPVATDFLLECCDVLWRTGRTDALIRASQTILSVGTTLQQDAAQLYLGLTLTEAAAKLSADAARETDPAQRARLEVQAKQQWQDGRHRLQIFTGTKDADPFPGARAEAWRRIARASRELLEPVSERTALNGYLQLEPETDGEAWLRLAEVELASPNAGYREPDLHFAHGMSLLPQRTAELMVGWHQIGALEMRSIGLDLESVRANLLQARFMTPPSDAPPYERYRLADMHAEVGDWTRAAAHVRRLLEQVPGFVPGLDLSIRIFGGQGKKRERMEALLERVRRAGRTAEIDAILHETPLEELDAKDLLALMRADPERSGRLALAGGMARRGHPAEALATLTAIGQGKPGEDMLGAEGRLLAASLHLEQRDPVRALEALAPLGQDLLPLPGGIEIYLRAALGTGDRARLEALGVTLARRLRKDESATEPDAAQTWPFDRTRALRIADAMLAAGDGAAALPILVALDTSPKLRGSDVVLRLVSCAALRGEDEEARTALERAQAFETKGGADYEALLLSALDAVIPDPESPDAPTPVGGGEDLSKLAEAVESAGFALGPLGHVNNALLQGRAAEVQPLLDARLDGPQARDAWWNLTAAAAGLLAPKPTPPDMPAWLGADAARQAEIFFTGPDGKRDPRATLALLGAARDPLGAPFTRAWLAHATAESFGDLWPDFLRASLDAWQGCEGRALEMLRRLRERHPDFGPAWDLEEQILAGAERTASERAEFRRQRDAHMGAAGGTGAELLLDKARTQRDAGALDEALQSARAALEADPWLMEARTLLSELQSKANNDRAALATLQDALGLDAPSDGRTWPPPRKSPADRAFVGAYLDVIARLRDAPGAGLPRARIETLLKTLAAQRPDDPRVVLALAEFDLGADPHNASLGVMRAYSRLDSFRAAQKGSSIEILMEGSVQAWAQFYLRLDPARAQSFLEEELALAPTVLSTWIEHAHAAEADGNPAEALRRMQLCARLAPRGDVLREVLRLRAHSDMPPEELEASVRAIVEAEHRTGPDAEIVLLQARCYLDLGPRYQGKVLELVNSIEPFRDISPDFLRRHSILWATAAMSRGTPEDVQTARKALEEVRGKGGTFQRGYVDALWGLAHAP